MENNINRGLPLLNWTYFYQEKNMDHDHEFRQSLALTTVELEEARVLKAQEEIKLRDEQISQLKSLLATAIKERDEAKDKCERMYMELERTLLSLQQQSGISSNIINNDHHHHHHHNHNHNYLNNNNGLSLSSSECDDDNSIVVSSQGGGGGGGGEAEFPIVVDRPLPEKGKFLQAVMKAGPLLQTLLLAGPLPQWRHPPPPIDTYQIPPPPVVLPNNSDQNCTSSRKRGVDECCDSSTLLMIDQFKYQRVVLH